MFGLLLGNCAAAGEIVPATASVAAAVIRRLRETSLENCCKLSDDGLFGIFRTPARIAHYSRDGLLRYADDVPRRKPTTSVADRCARAITGHAARHATISAA